MSQTNHFTKKIKNIAIITGATGGLGKAFTDLLNQDLLIDEIWAIARSEENLKKLAEEFGLKVKIFPLDLGLNTSYDKVKTLLEQEKNCQVTYLVNNAGYGKFGSYADLKRDESLNLIDVNCKSHLGLILEVLPFMNERAHIINVASQAGFQPLPYFNIYAASKAFVISYSQALNMELKTRRISVTAVCPGWINTNFINNAQTDALNSPSVFKRMADPYQVAKKALKSARKNKAMSVYGFKTKFLHVITKILPQKIVMKFWMRQQKINS